MEGRTEDFNDMDPVNDQYEENQPTLTIPGNVQPGSDVNNHQMHSPDTNWN